MLEHRSLRRHLDFGFTSVVQTYYWARLSGVIVSKEKEQLKGRHQTIGRSTPKKKGLVTNVPYSRKLQRRLREKTTW
jgi:hypothetical protein